MRSLVGLAAIGLLATAANAQEFFATNNLSNTNYGTGGDELIKYDFSTASWVSVGVINVGGVPVPGGFAGLDWEGGVGVGDLIGAIGFSGGLIGEVYRIDPTNANATFLGLAPVDLGDLAYNPANGKMYGTSGGGNTLYRDDDGDSVPETVVGAYIPGVFEVGLGFDASGNLYVLDLGTDQIYKGTGDNPATLVSIVALTYDANFSQGLYVGGGQGYHGALNNSLLTSENYTFNLDGTAYTLQSTFATHPVTGLPEVEVGDLTPVPPPCPWDCDGSGDNIVSTADLLRLLSDWAEPSPCDFDGSGTVTTADLLKLLGEWGPC
jgi:hypothetical protein